MAVENRKSPRGLVMFSALSVMILISLWNAKSPAQSENETCPCFGYEQVEAIFLSGEGLSAEERIRDCRAEDYKVEFTAEAVVWDQNYDLLAQATVNWYDFDPGGCEYINNMSGLAVESSIRWPHPAPEGTARACFDIISSVIAKKDTDGNCTTYP
jgi:hypothetical protein